MLTVARQTKAGTIRRTILLGIDAETLACVGIVSEAKQGKRSERIDNAGYRLRRIPSAIGGIGVECIKDEDGEVHHVLLNAPGGHSCECAWSTYRPDGKACRHVEMCLQAVRDGLI